MPRKPKTFAPPRCSITALTILTDSVEVALNNLDAWPEDDRAAVEIVLMDLGTRLCTQVAYAARGVTATMEPVLANDDCAVTA